MHRVETIAVQAKARASAAQRALGLTSVVFALQISLVIDEGVTRVPLYGWAGVFVGVLAVGYFGWVWQAWSRLHWEARAALVEARAVNELLAALLHRCDGTDPGCCDTDHD